MSRINLTAVLFWAVTAGIGYLIGGPHMAFVFGLCAMGLSLVIDVFS